MHGKKEFGKLASDFRDCREVLIALGEAGDLRIIIQERYLRRVLMKSLY